MIYFNKYLLFILIMQLGKKKWTIKQREKGKLGLGMQIRAEQDKFTANACHIVLLSY